MSQKCQRLLAKILLVISIAYSLSIAFSLLLVGIVQANAHSTSTTQITQVLTPSFTAVSISHSVPKSSPTHVPNTAPDQLQSNSLNLFIALVGIMGVGVGVAASLIPTELSSKRDYYQRLTRIWQLLAFEINSIIAQCDSYDNHPEDQWAKVSELPSLPSIAWQVAMTNGVDAEPETLQELGIAYATLERLNATISCYTEFSGRGMLQGGYPGGCQSYNREFKEQCYNTVHLFKGLTGKVDSFISASQENAKKVQRQINGLGVFGVVMLILTVLLTCILTPTAFFH